eukprot:429610-Alexandrium_andersonii.AAC.1
MSASLVGSEMCIRDSFWQGTAQMSLHARIACARSEDAIRIALVSRGPVSYTHLTLPTICSV